MMGIIKGAVLWAGRTALKRRGVPRQFDYVGLARLRDWGGIRLENMIVVRQDGAEVLNRLKTTGHAIGADADDVYG